MTEPVGEYVSLFRGFNPPMVASCLRDSLRFLFSTAAPDRLKYSSDPKQSAIAVDLAFDPLTSEDIDKRPKVIINRGAYQAAPIGLTDSMSRGDMVNPLEMGQTLQRSYMNTVAGNCSIKVVAWNMGTCEELAYLVMTFLCWSRPMLCNTLGFKNIAAPVSSSPLMLDKDDKEKYIIEVSVPYITEMQWMDKDIGAKLKGFLLEMQSN